MPGILADRRALGQPAAVATGERDYVSGRMPVDVWEITADEWRRRRGG